MIYIRLLVTKRKRNVLDVGQGRGLARLLNEVSEIYVYAIPVVDHIKAEPDRASEQNTPCPKGVGIAKNWPNRLTARYSASPRIGE